MNDNLKYTLILVFVSFLWGAAYPVMKIAINDTYSSPTLIMGSRFIFAAVLLITIFYKRFIKLFRRKMIKPVFVVSLALFLDFFFYSIGLKLTTAINSGFFTGISVIFVPFVMLAFDRKSVKKADILPVLVTVIGVYFLGSNSGTVSLNKGDWLCLMSPVMFAIYVVLLSRMSHGIDPVCFTVIQMFTVGIMGLLTSFLLDGLPVFSSYSYKAWIALPILIVFGTAMPFLLQNYAQPHSSPLAAAIIFSLMPLFSLIVSGILLGESLAWRGYLGGLLMVGAVVLAKLFPDKIEGENTIYNEEDKAINEALK